MSVVLAVLLISFLIFIHELGHFITAKIFKVQVNEFSLFLGPALWKKQIGQTLYSVRCIPIGGYCAVAYADAKNSRSFQNVEWWKGLLILLSGPAMNFFVGLLLFCLVRGLCFDRSGTDMMHLQRILSVGARFSVNLGWINLLPLPGLDGGRMVTRLTAAVRNRV